MRSVVNKRVATGKFFANLAYRINPERPFESLSVGLALQRKSYRFPGDDEFRNALEERDIFGKRVCHDLLDRLENHNSKRADKYDQLFHRAHHATE